MTKIQFTISDMDNIKSNNHLDTLIGLIAEFTIENNLYRKEDEFYDFTRKELVTITRYLKNENLDWPTITHGYCFLNEPNIPEGLIKLLDNNDGNPKWIFWKNDDGTIEFESA